MRCPATLILVINGALADSGIGASATLATCGTATTTPYGHELSQLVSHRAIAESQYFGSLNSSYASSLKEELGAMLSHDDTVSSQFWPLGSFLGAITYALPR